MIVWPAPIALLLVAAAAVAAAAPDFFYDPQPRWTEDPETEVVCEAVAKECPGALKDGQIQAEFGYDELYDIDGMLAGIRMVKSTGCKPLDEHLVLGERHFKMVFHKDGEPDLDGVHAEVAPGTPKESVRIVKRGSTSVSFGC